MSAILPHREITPQRPDSLAAQRGFELGKCSPQLADLNVKFRVHQRLSTQVRSKIITSSPSLITALLPPTKAKSITSCATGPARTYSGRRASYRPTVARDPPRLQPAPPRRHASRRSGPVPAGSGDLAGDGRQARKNLFLPAEAARDDQNLVKLALIFSDDDRADLHMLVDKALHRRSFRGGDRTAAGPDPQPPHPATHSMPSPPSYSTRKGARQRPIRP
jgi:hypothetical protein